MRVETGRHWRATSKRTPTRNLLTAYAPTVCGRLIPRVLCHPGNKAAVRIGGSRTRRIAAGGYLPCHLPTVESVFCSITYPDRTGLNTMASQRVRRRRERALMGRSLASLSERPGIYRDDEILLGRRNGS
jgi:hypothetical protein